MSKINGIDESYFIGPINVPSSEFSNLPLFIEIAENKVLEGLLGPVLAASFDETVEPFKSLVEGNDYTVNYCGKEVTVHWDGLKNEKKISPIAYLAYCLWLQDAVARVSTSGVNTSKQENSKAISPALRISMASSLFDECYGKMYGNPLKPSAYAYIKANEALFADWFFEDLTLMFNSHDI